MENALLWALYAAALAAQKDRRHNHATGLPSWKLALFKVRDELAARDMRL